MTDPVAQTPTPTPAPTTPATPTPTPAPDAGSLAGGATPPAPPAPVQIVPEAYKFEAPKDRPLSDALVAAATPIFKDLGLSQDNAQKLVDFYNKSVDDFTKQQIEGVNKLRTQWMDEIRADKELGGNLDNVRAEIGRLKERLPEDVRNSFNEAMNFTGAGDNPAFVRAFFKIAQLVNEGRPVAGTNPSPAGQSASGTTQRPTMAASMYPSLVK